MYETDNDDFDLIETEYELIDEADAPDPNKWQSYVLSLEEMDCASHVCWHAGAKQKRPIPNKPNQEQYLGVVLRDVASWFVQMENKFIPTGNKDSRLGIAEMEKLLPQMLADRFPSNERVAQNSGKITGAVMFGTGPDPRLTFGVYSGKAYPQPGNKSKRLFRNGMWDINTWRSPAYRTLSPSAASKENTEAFDAMLEFAIPEQAQRDMLLDWIAWNLQNEGNKPTWAIMLYSETKGTGKSTIAKVLTALFGEANTALCNGIKPLTQRFAADSLDRKLVVAEEVHISSHSTEGNALKDLITNTSVSVERKYQPIVTIPQQSCFVFMTNHKPLWLEGGERRYYIINMDHDGHSQGERNEEFYALAAAVNEQVNNPQFVRDLYQRLMTRELSPEFDAKNMRFNDNATPIMRELQAISGNEGEHVLQSLLDEYNVSIIPSEDMVDFVAYLKLRNANSLRNILSKLGWESRRYRFAGAQHRVWCPKTLEVENGRVSHPELANTYNGLAEANGYTWFDMTFYVNTTWKKLHQERLVRGGRKTTEEYSASAGSPWDNSEGKYGPFLSSDSHLRLQARTKDDLTLHDADTDEADVHYIKI
jgi:hypothetical protein